MRSIVLGINSLVQSQYPAYNNHLQLFFKMGRELTDTNVMLCNPSRMSIDNMRNMAAKICIDAKADYLVFLDDDVCVPPDAIQRLLSTDADIIAGDVLIRGYPFDHMAFRYDDKGDLVSLKSYGDEQGKIAKVDAVGFSLVAIKREILEQVPQPYFVTGKYNTEDIYFCVKAKHFIPNINIVVDTSIECSHILGFELINNSNRVAYSKYLQAVNRAPKEPTIIFDSNVNYEESVAIEANKYQLVK